MKKQQNIHKNTYSIIRYLARSQNFLAYEHDDTKDYWHSVVRDGKRGREISFDNFGKYMFQQNILQLKQTPKEYVKRAFSEYRLKYGSNPNLEKLKGLIFDDTV